MDICPTGYTTISTTYTAPAWSGMAKPEVPYGWTTTVTVCDNCAAYPTTVTITKPMAYPAYPTEAYPAGPMTTATIYTTKIHTVTVQKGPSAYSYVSIEVYPVYTTTYPGSKSMPVAPEKYASSMPAGPEKYVSFMPAAPVKYSSSMPAVEKYVSSMPVKPVAPGLSSVPYAAVPYVSVVNATAMARPSYASTASVNVKPAVTSKYAAAELVPQLPLLPMSSSLVLEERRVSVSLRCSKPWFLLLLCR